MNIGFTELLIIPFFFFIYFLILKTFYNHFRSNAIAIAPALVGFATKAALQADVLDASARNDFYKHTSEFRSYAMLEAMKKCWFATVLLFCVNLLNPLFLLLSVVYLVWLYSKAKKYLDSYRT